MRSSPRSSPTCLPSLCSSQHRKAPRQLGSITSDSLANGASESRNLSSPSTSPRPTSPTMRRYRVLRATLTCPRTEGRRLRGRTNQIKTNIRPVFFSTGLTCMPRCSLVYFLYTYVTRVSFFFLAKTRQYITQQTDTERENCKANKVTWVRRRDGIDKESTWNAVEWIPHWFWLPSPLRCMNDWSISSVTEPIPPPAPPLAPPPPSMPVAPPNAPKPTPLRPRPMPAPVIPFPFPPLPNPTPPPLLLPPSPCGPKPLDRPSPPLPPAPVFMSPPPRPAPTPAPRPPLSARCISCMARC